MKPSKENKTTPKEPSAFANTIRIISKGKLLDCKNYFWYTALLDLNFFLTASTSKVLDLSFYASTTKKNDEENQISCGLSKGILTLKIIDYLYVKVGLNGKKDGQGRFVISVDLLSPGFKAGTPLYDRLSWCFSNTLTRKFEFEVVSVNKDDYVSCNTIDFHASGGEMLKLHKPEVRSNSLFNIVSPDFDILDLKEDVLNDSSFAFAILEWIGMVFITSPRISLNDNVDPFIALYSTPEPSKTIKTLDFTTITGFLSPIFVQDLQELSLKEDDEGLVIISVIVNKAENVFQGGGKGPSLKLFQSINVRNQDSDYTILQKGKELLFFSY